MDSKNGLDGWTRAEDSVPGPSDSPKRDYGYAIHSDDVIVEDSAGVYWIAYYVHYTDPEDVEFNGWTLQGRDGYDIDDVVRWRPLTGL